MAKIRIIILFKSNYYNYEEIKLNIYVCVCVDENSMFLRRFVFFGNYNKSLLLLQTSGYKSPPIGILSQPVSLALQPASSGIKRFVIGDQWSVIWTRSIHIVPNYQKYDIISVSPDLWESRLQCLRNVGIKFLASTGLRTSQNHVNPCRVNSKIHTLYHYVRLQWETIHMCWCNCYEKKKKITP